MDDKKKQITDSLISMIRDFKGNDFVEPDGDVETLTLNEDFELDSLDIINMLFQIDEQFGVKVAASDFEEHQLLVLGNMVKFIADNE
jgi:acyl carrier protein